MSRKTRCGLFAVLTFVLLLAGVYAVHAWDPLPVPDDPLVRMPGTQPGQVTLEAPGRCLNCHAGYNSQVEPGFNWKGSMMAQAARDFLFWSCLTVAGQDSIWAVGRPNAVDICERCHFPKGWLEGRSDPPNASAMTAADFDGVHCDVCHTMYDPFFETTYAGTREGNDWVNYWDETNASDTPSQPAADATHTEDMAQAQAITLFNGGSFFTNNLPPATYDENGAGQYFVSAGGEKRAPFADADARHQIFYSRYHKSRYFCSTCHDVSNAVLANLAFEGTPPGDGTTILPTEENPAYSYFHVERTFSEFMLSAYAEQGGAPGIGPFAPEAFETSYPSNYIAKCQDCHMRDVVGQGCDMQGVPVRPNDSVEHPNSGQPLHDLTGGNAWVSHVLASAVAGSPNYDSVNDSLLNQGAQALTLDLTEGEGIDPMALLAGADRAKQQLQLAASIENPTYDAPDNSLSFRIQNQTGHKLISGFPEGRRMFVNIKAYSEANLIWEANPYDDTVGTLKGLDPNYSPNSPPVGPNEVYIDELVYEMHPSSTDLTGEQETFHFALATGRYKDNRIPPKGFRIADAAARLAEPVWHGASDPSYFTPDEYSGGYDEVSLTIPAGADYLEVNLYYQTTSREYIEFLRDEINGTANTLPDPSPGTPENEAYIIQTDPFFSQLKVWGETIWQLWEHNMNVPGAAPFLMTQATLGIPPAPCMAPTPTLLSVTPGHQQATLEWSDEHTGDGNIVGYKIYYDQAGKAQLVTEFGLDTTYTDTGLTSGQEYCYKVTSLYADCESGFSNVLCTCDTPSGGSLSSPADGSTTCDDTPTLMWNTVSGATSYQLHVADDTSFSSPVVDTTSSDSSYTLTSPLPPGTYHWRVRASNDCGYGSWSSPWSFTIDSAPSVAPSLSLPADASTTCDDTPSFDWSTVSGATSYRIQVDDDPAFASPVIDTTSPVSDYTPVSPLPPATYHWQIRASNTCGDGPWSSSWSFTISSAPSSAPSLTSPANASITCDDAPSFDWSSVSGATSYRIQVDDDPSFGSPVISATTSLSNYTPASPLSPGTYHWQIRASNTCGDGPWSSSWSFTIMTTPGVPTLTWPADGEDVADTTPTFEWNEAAWATSYDIQVSLDDSFTTIEISETVVVTSYTSVSDLPLGTHYWRVKASNSCGTGEWSTVHSFNIAEEYKIFVPLIMRSFTSLTQTWAYTMSEDSEGAFVTTAAYTNDLGDQLRRENYDPTLKEYAHSI